MQNTDPISQAIDFVEGHLQEAITVADMAEAAACSLYHFCRTFNQATHHTPYDYLMRRRLSEAAQALITTDRKIIDIACDYQFNSPETFSRAFKRMFGLQPNQLRKQGRLGRWACLPRLTREHLQQIAKGPYLMPALEERAAFQVAGLMTLVQGSRAAIAGLWERLAQPPQAPKLCGLAYYPDNWATDGYWYLAGFETPESERVPLPLVSQTVPAARYARFIHKGRLGDLPLTLDYIFYTWLPQSGQRLAHPLVVESYPPGFKNNGDEETEIEVCLPIQ